MDVLLDLPTKVYYRLYDYLAMIGFASYVTSNQVNMHHRRLGTTPAYVDFSALAGISLVLFIMLKILKSISNSFKRKMKKRILKAIEDRKSNRDGFRSKYGYSWDFVIVFPIRDKNDKITDKQKKNSLKAVIDALADGGLETKQFYSIQHDELYVKVRAPLYRLMREADRINYNLLVNDVQLCNMLQEGRPGKWPSVSVPSWSIETDIDPFKYIYAPFEYDNTLKNAREDLVNLYQRYSGESIFRGVDRMKLILSIISARKFEGGCFVDLHRLVRDGCILGFTPIHDVVELRK